MFVHPANHDSLISLIDPRGIRASASKKSTVHFGSEKKVPKVLYIWVIKKPKVLYIWVRKIKYQKYCTFWVRKKIPKVLYIWDKKKIPKVLYIWVRKNTKSTVHLCKKKTPKVLYIWVRKNYRLTVCKNAFWPGSLGMNLNILGRVVFCQMYGKSGVKGDIF